MTEVISVRFRGGCKAYFFDPRGITVREGEEVIVETAQGAEVGTCVRGNRMVEDHAVIQPLRALRRIVNDEDREIIARNHRREKDAFFVCEKKIAERKLEMKLVNVECTFEGNKIIFFFTADGRVDFRELVKDLASIFRARIELRQIGVRDEAKMLGGLGICGQPFCCKRFLEDFQPVSIKMAKTQNLSLNPTKISGSCGRLMCCLKYEQHAYEDAQTRMPRNDSFVQTPDGPGNISAVNLVRETVTVRLDETPEVPKTYSVKEVIVLRNGKGSRDGIAIPDRPARLRKEEESDVLEALLAGQFSAGRGKNGAQQRSGRGAEKHESRRGVPAAEDFSRKPEGKNGESRNNKGRNSRGNRNGSRKNEAASYGNKPIPLRQKGEKREQNRENQQALRPLRFGSSMPFAQDGALTEIGGNANRKENRPGKNRRSYRRFRGGNKSGDGGKKEG